MQDEHEGSGRVAAERPIQDGRPTIGVEVEEPLFLDESMEYLPAGRPPQGGSPFDLFADEETPNAGPATRAPLETYGAAPWNAGTRAPAAVTGRRHHGAMSPRMLAILSVAAAIAAFAAVRAWQMLAR